MKNKNAEASDFFRKAAERKPISQMNSYEMLGLLLTQISSQLEEIQVSLHQIIDGIQDPPAPEQEIKAQVKDGFFNRLFKTITN